LESDTRAFAALEYTLITVVIGIVVLGGVGVIGNALGSSYVVIGNQLSSLAAGA
jgi:Flp pilus assembly pilin Flp